MKLRYISIITILIVCAFTFLSCTDNLVSSIVPSTNLLSLKIQPISLDSNNKPIDRPGVDALEITAEEIPEPVVKDDWDDTYFNLTDTDYEELWFLLDEHVEIARLVANVSPGCIVQWGVGTSGTRPAVFGNPSEPMRFQNDDFLYIKVSTRNGHFYNHYRIHTRLASPVVLLSVITISGRVSNIAYDAGRENWDDAKTQAKDLPLSIAKKEGTNTEILVSKMDDNSTVEYATLKGDYSSVSVDSLNFLYKETENITVYNPETKEDEIQKGAVIPLIEDQDFLIVKVVSQNKEVNNFYKFRVSVGRMATIAKLEYEALEVLSLGVPNNNWSGVVSGNLGTPNQPDAGYTIKITLADTDATCSFVKITQKTSPLPDFPGSPAERIKFEDKEELAIRVKSFAAKDEDTLYYKIRLDWFAAGILEQPKSAVYNVTSYNYPVTSILYEYMDRSDDDSHSVPALKTDTDKWRPAELQRDHILAGAAGTRTLDRPIEPLTVKLDRTIANASYQWYTANSWYGCYGFDKDGRLRGHAAGMLGASDPGFQEDDYHPMTDRGGLDEKNNVAYHNGGNMYYRIPIGYPFDNPIYPGDAIPGATNATYTPEIDSRHRPIIASYTNQSQYYWVVVTDNATGRVIQSERAIIIAEWGEEFDNGKPTGNKITKKHHIVDLNNDLGLPKKNVKPFEFFREEYLIPITFPPGFDIMDYTTCVAQAVFYLADGRVWIQNWTQADINFHSIDSETGLPKKIVGYYNLTSDNATKGLAGGSNNPAGAVLDVNPTHVGIAVAGEKGPTNMPPFLSDGITPDPGNYDSAQAWFCAYIELVELRFEGPSRK